MSGGGVIVVIVSVCPNTNTLVWTLFTRREVLICAKLCLALTSVSQHVDPVFKVSHGKIFVIRQKPGPEEHRLNAVPAVLWAAVLHRPPVPVPALPVVSDRSGLVCACV